jgi:hypothetical protein
MTCTRQIRRHESEHDLGNPGAQAIGLNDQGRDGPIGQSAVVC